VSWRNYFSNAWEFFGCSQQKGFKLSTSVFFNLSAAEEPSANVWVAHGTLCNDPSVYIARTAQNCGCDFRPRQFRPISRTPGSHSRKPGWKTLIYVVFLSQLLTHFTRPNEPDIPLRITALSNFTGVRFIALN